MSSPKADIPELFAEVLSEAGISEAEAREIAGALAMTVDATPPRSLRGRLVETVSQPDQRYAPFWERLTSMFDLPLEAMRKVLSSAKEVTSWEAAPVPGVDLLHFDGGAQVATADCGLVRLAPGTQFPEHTHLGNELVFVLAGSYADSGGRVYSAGDVQEMPAGTSHSFMASPDDGCLFALVLVAGIEIPGLGKLGG